jgi:GT2 family glycosyltransferase
MGMPGADEHVATIVLNYNGREDTLACLASLSASEWERSTTIVVDNGSTDGSPEAVRAAYPDAVLLETGTNLGFAEGNNVGLRHALSIGAGYAFLLNNDATVAPGTIGALVDEARRRPRAGALCPLIFFADRREVIWYAGDDHDPARWHNGRQTGYGERAEGRFTEPERVGRLSGAAALVPRSTLEEVGLLDGDLFLYLEDTEWSLRMRAAGREIWLVPRAHVWHRVSMAAGGEQSPTIAYYGARNTLEVGDRYAGGGRVARGIRHAGTLAVHLVHARRARNPLVNARAVLDAWRDFRGGMLGPRHAPVPARESRGNGESG